MNVMKVMKSGPVIELVIKNQNAKVIDVLLVD